MAQDCSECGGCGSTGTPADRPPAGRLEELLQRLEQNDGTSAEDHTLVDAVCQALAHPHYTSYVALARLSSSLTATGAEDRATFAAFSRRCQRLGLLGPLVSWALEGTDHDLEEFQQRILVGDSTLFAYVNDQAAWFETVNGMPPGQCGRVQWHQREA
ncbi:hypothetical protein IWQ60_003781 [Tieghemiomyces parasiticus]|uniref:Uncharacterized protein n=1 Tax=Tieghemiomyces parasiticus TaxID=78921 RepID=A0A9W8AA43_9FUNG|nr:hypothetical protein IWQ60_003781 [Tieghemiomyces parasiticus]